MGEREDSGVCEKGMRVGRVRDGRRVEGEKEERRGDQRAARQGREADCE